MQKHRTYKIFTGKNRSMKINRLIINNQGCINARNGSLSISYWRPLLFFKVQLSNRLICLDLLVFTKQVDQPEVFICESVHLKKLSKLSNKMGNETIVFDWPRRLSHGNYWYQIVFKVQLFDLSPLQIV